MTTKEEKIKSFDPNGEAVERGIFGLPFDCEEADVILVPAPWEVTCSSGTGTSRGPHTIMVASRQVDLFSHRWSDFWKNGVAMDEYPPDRVTFVPVLSSKSEIDEACAKMVKWVRGRCEHWLNQNKVVGVVGGEHSVALGNLQAHSARGEKFGILQIDAHMDLRSSYQGYAYSHASVMNKALELPGVEKLVQVGVRDFCEEEYKRSMSSGRIRSFTMHELRREGFRGISWQETCGDIIAHLPDNVYITFDIDGLDVQYCPNTGTPVPGGLGFNEAAHLLEEVMLHGKRIIGFDLVEVGGDVNSLDGNVAVRVLWDLCGLAWKGQNR